MWRGGLRLRFHTPLIEPCWATWTMKVAVGWSISSRVISIRPSEWSSDGSGKPAAIREAITGNGIGGPIVGL
jgi:hypothetical protein